MFETVLLLSTHVVCFVGGGVAYKMYQAHIAAAAQKIAAKV